MNIEIDLHDYLSEEDIKDEAKYALRSLFANQLRKEADIERVLSNLTHEYIFKMVCDKLNVNREYIESAIADGVKKAIEGDTIKYKVFQRKDAWERSESPAIKILDDTLANSKELIEAEVERRIREYDFHELQEEIQDTIYEVICRKLKE